MGSEMCIRDRTALHITTKDIPNWFWATFEHVDNPSREGAEGWQTPTVDSASDFRGFPSGLGIENSRWQYYRLRGTQVDFVDSFGNPTILANSQIESGFQVTSSCITCHARAAIGPRIPDSPGANRLSIFKSELPQNQSPSIVIGNSGVLPEELFVSRTFNDNITGELKYLQLDFVWSLMRAQRKVGSTGQLPDEVNFSQHIRPLFRQRDIDAMKQAQRGRMDLSKYSDCLLYTSPSPRDLSTSRMPSSA